MITSLYLRVGGGSALLLGLAAFSAPRAFIAAIYDNTAPTLLEVNLLASLGVSAIALGLSMFFASPSSLLPLVLSLVVHVGLVPTEFLYPMVKPDPVTVVFTGFFGTWCIAAIVARPSASGGRQR